MNLIPSCVWDVGFGISGNDVELRGFWTCDWRKLVNWSGPLMNMKDVMSTRNEFWLSGGVRLLTYWKRFAIGSETELVI